MTLRDPDSCPNGHEHDRILSKRKGLGCRIRRHECVICRARWDTFESLIDPKRVTMRPIERPVEVQPAGADEAQAGEVWWRERNRQASQDNLKKWMLFGKDAPK